MILPTTYALTLLVLLLSMICWGSWANTLKKSGWRFELFYLDFAIGSVIAALIAAFTFGSMGADISVQDNFLLTGKKQIAMAFLAGCVFNLANMLIVAAIELAGMSVAFPVGLGLALIVGVVLNYATQRVGNPIYLFGGCLIVLVAVVLNALAHGQMEKIRRRAAAAAAPPPDTPEAGAPKRKRPVEDVGPGAYRGVWLALAGGLLMGSFYPLINISTEGELGITNPYAVTLIFSFGILVSTFIYNLYFMNLPVKGLPISPFAYFTGSLGQHFLGLLGGMIWMVGAVANFVGAAAHGEANAGPALTYALGQAATLVSLFWGLFLWKEFAGASSFINRLLGIMTLLFLLGLWLVSVAPLK